MKTDEYRLSDCIYYVNKYGEDIDDFDEDDYMKCNIIQYRKVSNSEMEIMLDI